MVLVQRDFPFLVFRPGIPAAYFAAGPVCMVMRLTTESRLGGHFPHARTPYLGSLNGRGTSTVSTIRPSGGMDLQGKGVMLDINRELLYSKGYLGGAPKLGSASTPTEREITSIMYLAGVMPAKSAPPMDSD